MDAIHIIANEKIGTVNPNIYGHFTEHIGGVIYDGLWIGKESSIPNIRGFRKGIVDALKRIGAPVIRWPGGCFAETYDWRDGIGPAENRPTRMNWWYGNDRRLESNQVGTHEFMDFCTAVGAEPYFAANITSTTPLEIRNWVEYCTFPEGSTTLAGLRAENGSPAPFDVKFWGIGNENWGGGGRMTPDDYASLFRKYVTIAANAGGPERRYIACGPSGNDVDWTIRFFEKMRDGIGNLPKVLQGFAAHYYCGSAGGALRFDRDQWYHLLSKASIMEDLVVRQRAAMDAYDPERRIGLLVDEWGCWHPDGSGPSKGENLFEQQNTMRDAIVAALTLNIFNNHCDKVVMANIAQLVNNLHSLFLAHGDHLIETPTFDVFDMFKGHQGGTAVRVVSEVEAVGFDDTGAKGEVPGISCSASIKNDMLTVTPANLRYDEPAEVRIEISGARVSAERIRRAVLSAADPHACNSFEDPHHVRAVWSEIEPKGALPVAVLPAASVMMLEIPLEERRRR